MAATAPSMTIDDDLAALLERAAIAAPRRLRDRFGRAITDLRLSVTDRCNYKCVYCRTGNEGAQYSELPIEEYARMVRLFVSLGVEKGRLTGGEPLLRRGLLDLIREIAEMQPAFSAEALDGSPEHL